MQTASWGGAEAEAEHCYEAGGDSGFISRGPVPQYLSVQTVPLRVVRFS